MINRFTLTLLAFLFIGHLADAQPRLNFTRAINNWPTIELYFTITCDGNLRGTHDKNFLRVKQNGMEVRDFELWCPFNLLGNEGSKLQLMNHNSFRCGLSASLVLDVRSGIAGYLNSVKAGARSFIDGLDGVNDEAAITAFHSVAWVVQAFTTVKPLTYNAINSLQAGDSTGSVWDGVYAGLTELIANGVNQCRGVVVLSGGKSVGGTRTPEEIISLANKHRERIYTIGLGSSVDEQELANIAFQTGGRYYPVTDPSKLVDTYQTINTIFVQGHQECIITYSASCPDGSLRDVELTLKDFCNGSDSGKHTFKAPYDPSKFTDLYIGFSAVRIEEDSAVILPITLSPAISGDSLRAARFVLPFDTSLLSFQGVLTDASTILQDSLLQYVIKPSGIEFTTKAVFLPAAASLLMKLMFKAKTVTSVTQTSLQFTSWSFIHGCYAPRPQASMMTIYPKGTLSVGDVPLPRSAILYQNYPNPFNPSTMIEFELPAVVHARLTVFDPLGREVRELLNEHREAGLHRLKLSMGGLPSGVYMYRLEADGQVLTRWMMVMR